MRVIVDLQGNVLERHEDGLSLIHISGERMKFEAPLPEDMHKIITRLHNGQF